MVLFCSITKRRKLGGAAIGNKYIDSGQKASAKPAKQAIKKRGHRPGSEKAFDNRQQIITLSN